MNWFKGHLKELAITVLTITLVVYVVLYNKKTPQAPATVVAAAPVAAAPVAAAPVKPAAEAHTAPVGQPSEGVAPLATPTAAAAAPIVQKPAVASAPLPPPPPVFVEEKTADRVQEEELVRQMFNMDSSIASRANAATALSDYRYYRVARALSFLLQRDHIPQLRAAAATSMGEVANSSFLPMLQNSATKDPDPGVRTAAQTAVVKILTRASAGQDY